MLKRLVQRKQPKAKVSVANEPAAGEVRPQDAEWVDEIRIRIITGLPASIRERWQGEIKYKPEMLRYLFVFRDLAAARTIAFTGAADTDSPKAMADKIIRGLQENTPPRGSENPVNIRLPPDWHPGEPAEIERPEPKVCDKCTTDESFPLWDCPHENPEQGEMEVEQREETNPYGEW